MADTTREQDVVANNTAIETKYGAENWNRVIIGLLKDINISLAKLVDNGGNNNGES